MHKLLTLLNAVMRDKTPWRIPLRLCQGLDFQHSCSWLNQVEIRFNIIIRKAIRRGSLASVAQLKERILRFTDHYNPGARPFLWTATADSILHKIQRLCMAVSGIQH